MRFERDDTIAAVATPPGRGAISLIRLSGGEAHSIVATLLKNHERLPARRPLYTRLFDGDGQALDDAVVTYFPGPESYTGEDVVEISTHGSPVIVQLILDSLLEKGGRLAEPGEFTLRAFLNGKIDLAQAEAVQDLIESQTRFQAKLAHEQLRGSLSEALAPVEKELVHVIAHLETRLEFVEDEVEPEERQALRKRLLKVDQRLLGMEESYRRGRIFHDGIRVVLAGKPNSGKSSIFNSLLKSERAIVTAIPGTTRDALEEVVELEGIPVTLVDTAGIREGEGLVEQLGVERSIRQLASADLVLFVLDSSRPFDLWDQRSWESLRDRDYILVENKNDLEQRLDVPSGLRDHAAGQVEVSALKDRSLKVLLDAILHWSLPEKSVERERAVVTNIRHRECLKESRGWLGRSLDADEKGMSEEFVIHDLRKALSALGQIRGETTNEEILSQIFSSFCIGK
ncbi:MAG: tRNA uridine-5-carboxymethylaminomethyl(34) synthesis GTPase MnmE [Acidobacteriota bacterium]|nr:MAG: tRNA uridine-5-carboxymethylaminomethyl(34) synthesis GTPase MnmE [Acidobacteriota bacterium]